MLFHRATANARWNGADLYVNSAKPSLAPRLSLQPSEFGYATSSTSDLDGTFHVFAGRRLGTTLEVRRRRSGGNEHGIVTLVAVHGKLDDATMHALECGLLAQGHRPVQFAGFSSAGIVATIGFTRSR